MTIESIEAQLKKIDRQRERLHRELETRKRKEFTALPARVGLKSVDQLILSLAPYASTQLQARLPGNGTAPVSKARRATASKRAKTARRNTRYTEQQRAAVKAAVEKGGKTVSQISKEVGVAEYTIIDWKKRWGLVKKRKKTTRARKK